MTYRLHKNGIITGSLNSFCLACDIFFKFQQEATDHIGSSKHKKKSDAVQYSDKFQDEHIKKFKCGYYCEFCNALMPIASKVNLAPSRMTKHFDDTEHHELYAKRRVETNSVRQEIDTKENCQGSEAKGNCQEKATNMTSAIENDGEKKKPMIDNDVNKNSNKKFPTKDKSKILESIARYQSKGININLDSETAFCKKCSKIVTFFMEIENHIENHFSAEAVDSDLLYPSNLDQNLNRVDVNDKTTQSSDDKQNTDIIKALQDNVRNATSHGEDYDTEENFEKCNQEEEARDFAKANTITYNVDNYQSFCHICKVHVPGSFRSMKEHVEGANHKRLVGSSITHVETPRKQVKQSTREFIDSAYVTRGMRYVASIINEKFCILWYSMYLVSPNNSGIRCFVCEITLPPFLCIVDHVHTRMHHHKWQEVPVVTSERREFIREVRPEMYHCGYCNLIVSGWANMTRQLDCSDHRENRSVWERRMELHNLDSDLQRHKLKSIHM